MATLPELQGRSLGRRVLADAPGRRLSESVGFVETAPGSLGMRLDR